VSELLRQDNHELWTHVRLMAIKRDPVMSWEEIAIAIGLEPADVPDLLAWFLSYRLPPFLHKRPTTPGMALPRDPTQRAEYLRLIDREESLLTVVSEAPKQLATVHLKMIELERRKPLPPGGRYFRERQGAA
jgi:hypothetical protein